MALDSLTARANTGAGMDALAGKQTSSGFAGAAVLVDSTGAEVSNTNGLATRITSLYYPASTGNNTTVQLAAGASFTGTIENILSLQAAQVQVVCDQPYSVRIDQFIDAAGNKLTSSDTFTRAAGVPLNENVTLPGNYFRITLTNLGQATTTTLQLDTTFGMMNTQPRALSNSGNFPVSLGDVKGQTVWRTTFAKTLASGVDTGFWNLVATGSGQTVSQSSGNLVLAAGTTINSETIIRSKQAFNGSLVLKAQTTLSQRIINNNFIVELVDVIGDGLAATASSATALAVTIPNNPFTSENVGQSLWVANLAGGLVGVPNRYTIASVSGTTVNFTVAGFTVGSGTVSLFGWNYHQLIYTGTVVTNVSYDCQRRGWASGATTATINTTASPGHLAVMGIEDGNAFLADQLVASSTGLQLTTRASRVANVPEETTNLYVQIRSLNGSTAPASTTTWTIGTVSVEDYTPIQASLTNVRAQGINTALPVQVYGTASVSGTVTSTVTGGTVNPVVPATPYFVNSAATTNGALILTGTSGLSNLFATNTGATDAFVKLYNKATAPTVGTDVPEMIITVPAAVSGKPGQAMVDCGFHGFRFALGLGIAITGAAADSDTTAVAAGQVKVKLSRTV